MLRRGRTRRRASTCGAHAYVGVAELASASPAAALHVLPNPQCTSDCGVSCPHRSPTSRLDRSRTSSSFALQTRSVGALHTRSARYTNRPSGGTHVPLRARELSDDTACSRRRRIRGSANARHVFVAAPSAHRACDAVLFGPALRADLSLARYAAAARAVCCVRPARNNGRSRTGSSSRTAASSGSVPIAATDRRWGRSLRSDTARTPRTSIDRARWRTLVNCTGVLARTRSHRGRRAPRRAYPARCTPPPTRTTREREAVTSREAPRRASSGMQSTHVASRLP